MLERVESAEGSALSVNGREPAAPLVLDVREGSIEPGAAVTVTAAFRGSSSLISDRAVARLVFSNATVEELRFALSARPVSCDEWERLDRFDFVGVQLGDDARRSITFKNVDTVPVEYVLAPIPSSSPFRLVSATHRLSLRSGAMGSFEIGFIPRTEGFVTESVEIAGGPCGPESIILAGTGLAAVVSFMPSTLDFGTVQVGSSRAFVIRFTNLSAEPILLEELLTSAPFSVVGPGVAVEIPRAMRDRASNAIVSGFVDVTVRYMPSAVGPVSGTLSMRTSTPGQARLVVPMAGVGGPP